ncbi:TPR-like protein [Mycena latifolia]|nr:TPR-like protein [Mycena latifolia]
MFRAGDPLNPYDPASLDFPDNPFEFMRRVQDGQRRQAEIYSDPEKQAEYEQYMRDNAEERARTGETELEQMLREKREWAEADAKSAELKIQGNEAFRKGDYENAFVIYTACMSLSNHEPLYPLNRAAVALKLKLYETAVQDATIAIDIGDFQRAKAHFRRGQACCFLGKWDKADEEYTKASILQPGDPNIRREFEELKRLRGLSTDEQALWLSEKVPKTIADIFETGELKRRAEEVAGRSLD